MYGSIPYSSLYKLLRLFLLVLNRFLGRRMAKLVLLVSAMVEAEHQLLCLNSNKKFVRLKKQTYNSKAFIFLHHITTIKHFSPKQVVVDIYKS
jgi:hypothetical protein